MANLNVVRGGSFNQLLNIIKGLPAKTDSRLSGHQNAKILSKLMQLTPSISHLMKEHPQHIPVLLYHLSSVTSNLKITDSRQCVTGIDSKYNYLKDNHCKTCKGVCKEIYSKFLETVEENLPSLGPKGLSNIISVYSYCKNNKVSRILNEIELRMCYFIYCGCKRSDVGFKNSAYHNIDSILSRYSELMRKFPVSSLKEGDYLIDFIKHTLNTESNLETLVNKSKYYLPVNFMDISTTLDSLDSIDYTKDLVKSTSKKYSQALLTNYSKDNSDEFKELKDYVYIEGFKNLMLDLSFGFLFNNSFRSELPRVSVRESTENKNLNLFLDFESNYKFTNLYEIDTICRLINILKHFKYENSLLSSMIVKIIISNLEDLDFRNLVSLLDSLRFYKTRAHKVDFHLLVSRIDTLTSNLDLYSLRSLSTSIYIMSNMRDIVSLEDYKQFLKISKQALERYISKWKHLIKNQICLRAISTILKSIGDQETVDLVCNCVLNDLFSLDGKYLYDYNVILEVLIKHYRKVINNNYYSEEFSYNSSDNITTTNNNNNNNSNDDIDNYNKMNNTNNVDLCKIASTICLIVSKCSPYYCTMLSERLDNNKENTYKENKDNKREEKQNEMINKEILKERENKNIKNKNKNNQLIGIEMRELCYFLRNISNFNQIEMTENQHQMDYNDHITNLFKKVEQYFIKYQSQISDIDHCDISHFLSELS